MEKLELVLFKYQSLCHNNNDVWKQIVVDVWVCLSHTIEKKKKKNFILLGIFDSINILVNKNGIKDTATWNLCFLKTLYNYNLNFFIKNINAFIYFSKFVYVIFILDKSFDLNGFI